MRIHALRNTEDLYQRGGGILLLMLRLPLIIVLSLWDLWALPFRLVYRWWDRRRMWAVLRGKPWWHWG